MSESTTAEGNAEQIEYWSAAAGPKWVAYERLLDEALRPWGDAAVAALAPEPGESVLDVGCGCGDTSLRLAQGVAPGGRVLGVDVSEPMLGRAKERGANVDGLDFLRADAASATLPGTPFDALFSRFGVMFFTDPEAAFRHLRTALRPGGRVSFVCWQAFSENPWMSVALAAAADLLTLEPPDPEAPGPFAFADPERLRAILRAAGFADPTITDLRLPMRLATGDFEAVLEFLVQLGPLGAALREADPAMHPAVNAAVREALEPHFADGALSLPGAAWVVSSQSPA